MSSDFLNFKVTEYPASTKTSQEAATAIGCSVAQIAKSLVFKKVEDNTPVLVIASGINKVDLIKLKSILHAEITKPDANYVQDVTGFSVGGVPPAGHKIKMQTFIDEDLLKFSEIFASAGTGHSVFKVTPAELISLTEGLIKDVKQSN